MREETPPATAAPAASATDATTAPVDAASPAGASVAAPADAADATNAAASAEVAAHEESSTLGNSIEVLKEMAFNLLQEVKALSHSPAADVKRGVDFYDEVRRFEIDLITRALEITDGHQSRAARLLNLKITTLNSMMKRYGIVPPSAATIAVDSSLAPFAASAEVETRTRDENETAAGFTHELHNRAA